MADPKKVNVAAIADPRFVTLVGKPANQTAFKVVRTDGEPTMTTPQRRRVRRSDALVAVNFEAGVDEAQIKATMDTWGVTEFSVEISDTGARAVLRSDVDPEATMTVAMPDGVSATVLKPISNTASDTKTSVAVARMDFAADAFPELADVESWLKANDIDVSSVQIKRGDDYTSAIRIDSADTETHSINVDTGVNFQVIRSDCCDVPCNFVAVVSDTAYGSWGWGQLDFSAALADQQFCNLTEEAGYMLRRVLDQIIFYSDVPVESRKVLIKNSVNQYADYLIALLSALPTKVVLATRSSKPKENTVSTADKKAVQRNDAPKTDGESAGAGAATNTTTTAAKDTAPVTRADVESLISEAIGGLGSKIDTLTASLTQRVDTTTASGEAPAGAASGTEAPAGGEGGEGTSGEAQRSDTGKEAGQPSLEQVMRSVSALSENFKAVQEAVTRLQGTAVVRSDAGDGADDANKQPGKKVDVFRGAFGNLRGGKS